MIKIKFWCARCGVKGTAKVATVKATIHANVPDNWYVQDATDTPFVLCPECVKLSWQDKLDGWTR